MNRADRSRTGQNRVIQPKMPRHPTQGAQSDDPTTNPTHHQPDEVPTWRRGADMDEPARWRKRAHSPPATSRWLRVGGHGRGAAGHGRGAAGHGRGAAGHGRVEQPGHTPPRSCPRSGTTPSGITVTHWRYRIETITHPARTATRGDYSSAAGIKDQYPVSVQVTTVTPLSPVARPDPRHSRRLRTTSPTPIHTDPQRNVIRTLNCPYQ